MNTPRPSDTADIWTPPAPSNTPLSQGRSSIGQNHTPLISSAINRNRIVEGVSQRLAIEARNRQSSIEEEAKFEARARAAIAQRRLKEAESPQFEAQARAAFDGIRGLKVMEPIRDRIEHKPAQIEVKDEVIETPFGRFSAGTVVSANTNARLRDSTPSAAETATTKIADTLTAEDTIPSRARQTEPAISEEPTIPDGIFGTLTRNILAQIEIDLNNAVANITDRPPKDVKVSNPTQSPLSVTQPAQSKTAEQTPRPLNSYPTQLSPRPNRAPTTAFRPEVQRNVSKYGLLAAGILASIYGNRGGPSIIPDERGTVIPITTPAMLEQNGRINNRVSFSQAARSGFGKLSDTISGFTESISSRFSPQKPQELSDYEKSFIASRESRIANAQAKAESWKAGNRVKELQYITPLSQNELTDLGRKSNNITGQTAVNRLFRKRDTIISMGEGINPAITSYKTGQKTPVKEPKSFFGKMGSKIKSLFA